MNCVQYHVGLKFIDPAQAMDNGFIERLNKWLSLNEYFSKEKTKMYAQLFFYI